VKRGCTAALVLSGFVLLPALSVRAVAAEASLRRDKARTISVAGTATVKAAPDRVRIGFEVETKAVSAEKAAADNAKQSEAVLAALKGAVKPPGRVTTSGYQLNPEYSYGERSGARRRVLVGYVAVNRLRVVGADLAAAGSLIDKAVSAGATAAGSVSFFRDDLTAAKRQALLEAGRSARSDAEAIAESLGVSLGEVVTASSATSPPLLPQVRAMAMRDASASTAKTPIEAGEIAVSVTVNVIFAIR